MTAGKIPCTCFPGVPERVKIQLIQRVRWILIMSNKVADGLDRTGMPRAKGLLNENGGQPSAKMTVR